MGRRYVIPSADQTDKVFSTHQRLRLPLRRGLWRLRRLRRLLLVLGTLPNLLELEHVPITLTDATRYGRVWIGPGHFLARAVILALIAAE